MARSQYEKRRFVEMASVAMMHGRITMGQPVPNVDCREIVNKAGELFDELEHQYPEKREND